MKKIKKQNSPISKITLLMIVLNILGFAGLTFIGDFWHSLIFLYIAVIGFVGYWFYDRFLVLK